MVHVLRMTLLDTDTYCSQLGLLPDGQGPQAACICLHNERSWPSASSIAPCLQSLLSSYQKSLLDAPSAGRRALSAAGLLGAAPGALRLLGIYLR